MAPNVWNGNFSSAVLVVGASSAVSFKFLTTEDAISISSSPTGLEKGELYYIADSGGSTGTLHIKL